MMGPGAFVWYELASTDPAAAAQFYQAVVGWQPQAVPGMDYTMLKMGEIGAAGLMPMPEPLRAAGVPSHWNGYILVDDVAAAVARIEAQGGELRYPPTDIPGIGRFAVVADPQGAVFSVFTGQGEAPPAPPAGAPGQVDWRELGARDWESAFEFYAGLFGWSRGEAFDNGPMGTYQMFGYHGAIRGGMMNSPPGMKPAWLFYFNVEGIDAAVRRVQQAGGLVYLEPREVPGGSWIINCRDPQGAAFALVSQTR